MKPFLIAFFTAFIISLVALFLTGCTGSGVEVNASAKTKYGTFSYAGDYDGKTMIPPRQTDPPEPVPTPAPKKGWLGLF